MIKNKIILKAECDFKDNELRDWVSQLETKIVTLNERTKRQTIQIRDLEKRIRIMEVRYGRKMQT